MKTTALGVLAQDKWDFTQQTLNSIMESEQSPATYDLFLIDNGSSQSNKLLMKQWVEEHGCKNMFSIQSKTSIPIAWNLFLAATANYEYRTLVDNDIVLKGTLWAKGVTENSQAAHVQPTIIDSVGVDAGTNPGCPQNASIVKSVGKFRRQKKTVTGSVKTSDFLNKAQAFMSKYDTDILAFAAVLPNGSFDVMMETFVNDRHRGLPFLTGGCWTISKPAFDELGYFDERLSRMIPMDYSQRCVRSGMQIGYHDSYWVMHQYSPVNSAISKKEQRLSLNILDSDPPNKLHVDTRWTQIIDSINSCARDTQVINLQ